MLPIIALPLSRYCQLEALPVKLIVEMASGDHGRDPWVIG